MNLRRGWLIVACVGLLVAGCRKTWAPFYELDGQQQVLVARDGDAAFVSDEMAAVIAGLRAAPTNAREFDQAQALASKLEAERSRVTAERARENAPPPPTPTPTPPTIDLPQPTAENPAPPPPTTVDAGPVEPWQGMTEAEFVASYGSCFTSSGATTGPDGGAATGQLVKDTPACRKRFGAPEGETTWIFLNASGLQGSITRVRTTTVVVIDAGSPGGVDPSKTLRLLPGQQLPEGYVLPDAG